MEPCEDEVVLVAGRINATGKMLYWKNTHNFDMKLEEYAVAENMDGYDLIKIVGFIKTKKTLAGKFSNTTYDKMKDIVVCVGEI